MPKKLNELRERAGKYPGVHARFREGEKQVLEKDPECRTCPNPVYRRKKHEDRSDRLQLRSRSRADVGPS